MRSRHLQLPARRVARITLSFRFGSACCCASPPAERERRERQQMAELCDATLRDLGLSRADIWAELNKTDWRR